MIKLLAISLLAVSATSDTNWRAVIAAPCPRCVDAAWERKQEPLPIPERTVIHSFVGEFAFRAQWTMIDLDTGQVTERDWSKGSGSIIKHLGPLPPEALKRLRAASARLWLSSPLPKPYFAPGTVEQNYLISGSRLVAFSQFAPGDKSFVARLNATIKSVGATF